MRFSKPSTQTLGTFDIPRISACTNIYCLILILTALALLPFHSYHRLPSRSGPVTLSFGKFFPHLSFSLSHYLTPHPFPANDLL